MISDHKHFVSEILDYYQANARDLLWRKPRMDGSFDPYAIMVSEVMLQQTQVGRVSQKYQQFLELFPDSKTLANAALADVLLVWSGLGYNRRAKFLHQAAKMIVKDYDDIFPRDITDIQTLPGIGFNTAAAIATYAFNQKHVYIETNIRTVYIYHFYRDEIAVSDSMLVPHITRSLELAKNRQASYREWYWAIMDYGTYVKKNVGNLSAQSKHYKKQSAFIGSRRQIRGGIIKLLLSGKTKESILKKQLKDKRTDDVLNDLEKEGIIHRHNGLVSLVQ